MQKPANIFEKADAMQWGDSRLHSDSAPQSTPGEGPGVMLCGHWVSANTKE